MDIKIFTYGRGGARGTGMGLAGGIIRSEKWENHNSTHSKIKFYIILILKKILQMILKNF